MRECGYDAMAEVEIGTRPLTRAQIRQLNIIHRQFAKMRRRIDAKQSIGLVFDKIIMSSILQSLE